VRDDGVGFDTTDVNRDYSSRGSLGMINMRERAERIDGSLRVESAPGRGTSVILVVPLAKQGQRK
jgi:signal transduction histidine kinase